MNKLKDINILNKRVLIRVDYNIPILKGEIKNSFRLKSSIDTINYCLSQNCSIVLMTHLGRPKNTFDENYSVYPILDFLENTFNVFVHYSDDCVSKESINVSKDMLNKEIHLLENLRFHKEEIENNISFAEKLSKHSDIYINDAFGTAHRSHSSNCAILKFYKNNERCIGLLMEKEFNYLSGNLDCGKYTLIVGGAKISSKIKMINNFLDKSSTILIGGGMAFTFLKSQGYNIGKSIFEEDMIELARDIIDKANRLNVKILLPIDVVCSSSLSDDCETEICKIEEIDDSYMALDIGPETTMLFEMFIENSKNILWNGPLGAFEFFNFATGTQSISSAVRKTKKQFNATTIIGGGDTVTAIESTGNLTDFTHVSTGGGASLKLLSNEPLNIIEAWKKYDK